MESPNPFPCGPAWIPELIRRFMLSWFFEASCAKHDVGYNRGGTESDRYHFDLKFLGAMLRDAQRGHKALIPVKVPLAFIYFFWVRLGGWTSFNYR